MLWLKVKLAFFALVIAYHAYCHKLMRDLAAQRNTRSSKWLRGFNEVPALLLIVIVILAVVKPF
jgi:putative membrane protein